MIITEKINLNNLEKLKLFFKKNKKSKKNFRYYNTRKFDIIKNHLVTILYYRDNVCVGYGHLDKEENKVWLGIVVDEEHQNLGIGGLIMDDLLSKYKETIHLSVDKTNINAQKLYKKKLFTIIEENKNHYIMELKR
jgi:ribosomal protein S18 acetylase RimI-like enzyme